MSHYHHHCRPEPLPFRNPEEGSWAWARRWGSWLLGTYLAFRFGGIVAGSSMLSVGWVITRVMGGEPRPNRGYLFSLLVILAAGATFGWLVAAALCGLLVWAVADERIFAG